MARAEKVAEVAELTERFQSSSGAVLADYRGLTVAQLAELRHALGEQATFSVVKNTLTKLAAAEAGIAAELDGLLTGPSAIAFVKGDVVEAAKGLRDFAKANPALVIKGGVIDGKSMSPPEIERLAELESREVLLAMLAGAMKASMANAAATLAALPTQMARLAGALQARREAEPDAATGQADTAPADTAPADTAPADTAPADTAPADAADATPTETPNDEAVADAPAADQDQTEE
jgi:large subunit ribosomal protein L10